jgi:hypothetical protein
VLRRRLLVPILVVAAVVAIVVANLAVWSWSQVGDTDNFVAAVGPLADNPEIVDGVAHELTDRIVKRYPVVPRGIVSDLLKEVLETKLFRDIWVEQVRAAHRHFLDTADSGGDAIRLDLGAVLERVDQPLANVGLDVLSPDTIEQMDDVTVWRSEKVKQVAEAVRINNWFAWLMPPAAIALVLAALLLASNTWRAASAIGLGVALGMAVTALAAWFVQHRALDDVRNDLEHAASVEVWEAVSQRLWHQTLVLFVAGAAVAVAGAILGRRRNAAPA